MKETGICALSPSEENCYLAFPSSVDKGHIVLFDALTLQTVNLINAHKTPLGKLCFNQSGSLLSSASSKGISFTMAPYQLIIGTVIRVFSVQDPSKFYQFRR